jgi:hypothetical protein
MSPGAGVAAWPKPARSGSGRFIRVACECRRTPPGTYLAGVFFLWSMHADPRRATPLTLSQHGYYYGDRADVRRRLWGSSALALAAPPRAGKGTGVVVPNA